MSNFDEYSAAYKTLITCVAARVPVVLWGPPGQGKTSVIKQIAADQGRHLEVILAIELEAGVEVRYFQITI